MQKLLDGLYVGGYDDYMRFDQGTAILSATKKVHSMVLGALNKNDPKYISAEIGNYRMLLNWVDGPKHLYDWSGPETFTRALDFISRNISGGVLVHCDQGLSRSPTLCMAYLGKRVRPGTSFDNALNAIYDMYPQYQPGGILDYVRDHWNEIK